MKIDHFPFLEPGDLVGVAAPCARFDRAKLYKGIECLKTLGFAVRVPERIFETHRYLAGEDATRAGVIHDLAADPHVKGIICARGGFGAMRILPYLDWDLIRAHPKLFIGFSDATALLTALMQQAGIGGIHGPNLTSLADAAPDTLAALKAAMTGSLLPVTVPDGLCLKPGRAEGMLAGGNLATLTHLLGTGFAPDFSKGILFLEDVGEPAYKIDRMLSQMKLAGRFDDLCGVAAGSFDGCEHPAYLPEIFDDIFGEYGIPVLMGLAAGHGPVNLSLPMGRQVSLDADRMTLNWLKDVPCL
jgi:muramoyltetrapeptide carboxypeptidase